MGSEKEGFQTTQRPPQEVSRRPRTLQGLEVGANLAPRGVPKSIQNRSKSEFGGFQDPRNPQDTPKIPKWVPKRSPNRCEIEFEIHSKFIQHRCDMGVQTLLQIDLLPCFSTQQKYKDTDIQRYRDAEIQRNRYTEIQRTEIQGYRDTEMRNRHYHEVSRSVIF